MAALSQADKRTIAGRARTVQERLDSPHRTGDTVDDVDAYLQEWHDNVADGSPDAFQRRLGREGLGPEECRRRLSENGWPSDEPLPEWVERLDEMLAFAEENRDVGPRPALDTGVPFVDVLSPFLSYARTRAEDSLSSTLLSRSAADEFVRWLADRLSKVCSRTLLVEFKTYVGRQDPALVFDAEVEADPDSTEYYDAFVDRFLSEELVPFFLEYSFLGRLVVTVVRQWTSEVRTFVDRTADDVAALGATFGDGDDLGRVSAVDPVGDPHRGGRTVLDVTFESGVRVAYKPRNADIAAGYYELLEWVNANSDLPAFRTLDFLTRDRYAWMEWVQPAACATEDDVARYYRRAGMLICLFYALNAVDMHFQNFVADGDQPVAIDLETLAQPDVRSESRTADEVATVFQDSVLRTATLPVHHPDSDAMAKAGFGAGQEAAGTPVPKFTDVNTDQMDLQRGPRPDRDRWNLPRRDGEVARPEDNSEVIARGFRKMYQFVVRNREALLDDGGPIDRLAADGGDLRVVYRPTKIYTSVLKTLVTPDRHRTGLGFGCSVETLAKLPARGAVDEDVWTIYEAERPVLRRFNTPRLTVAVDGVDVVDGTDTVVEDFFETPPIARVRDRVRSFDESDLREQVRYIRWGFSDSPGRHAATGTPASHPADSGDDFESAARAAARGVFDRIEASSRAGEAAPTWVLREIGPDGGVYVHALDDDLYAGRVGIGVFAAALARTFEDDPYREFARAVVDPVVADLRGKGERPERRTVGATGLGSLVYGFTKMGDLLDADRYHQVARCAAEQFGPEAFGTDTPRDVFRGSAGAVLGLTALYDATGDADALERATAAGDHLLGTDDRQRDRPPWRCRESGGPPGGFAHGPAGIAYALLRLGDATGHERFRDAALASVGRDDERGRPPSSPGVDGGDDRPNGWCCGPTGRGLARLGMYEVEAHPELRSGVKRTLDGLDPSTLHQYDHVCCGNFGRVELLLRAGRYLDDPGARRGARQLARGSLQRADGRFRTRWQTDHWCDPSFFRGGAGIGYSLLRFLDRSLPCVLLWE